jgi:hypothetical protein
VRLFWNGFDGEQPRRVRSGRAASGAALRDLGRLVQDDVLARGVMPSSTPVDATGSGGVDPASWPSAHIEDVGASRARTQQLHPELDVNGGVRAEIIGTRREMRPT